MNPELSPSARLLLLVEDNPADAELVEESLENTGAPDYNVLRVSSMADAVAALKQKSFDVILLDLRLPDAAGLDTVRSARAVAADPALVVLTGSDDDELALACIDAGAQDFLRKSELGPVMLRRAIGYAITRLREARVRELRETLSQYRALSTSTTPLQPPGTPIAPPQLPTGPVRDRLPDDFAEMATRYSRLLEAYLDQSTTGHEKPRQAMESIVSRIGDLGGGPRDLMDLHVAGLEAVLAGESTERARALALEGRLLAVEMMALLVDYYRLGRPRTPDLHQ